MKRYYDGTRILEDVNRALEAALSSHGLNAYSLLGVTTVLEVIASSLKLQGMEGIAGREMGRLGQQAYYQSLVARKVALLQSPHSSTVNTMMEGIAVALSGATGSIADSDLERATLRVFLKKPRLSQAGLIRAHRENGSLAPAFLSARGYLENAHVISKSEDGTAWRLRELWEMD